MTRQDMAQSAAMTKPKANAKNIIGLHYRNCWSCKIALWVCQAIIFPRKEVYTKLGNSTK